MQIIKYIGPFDTSCPNFVKETPMTPFVIWVEHNIWIQKYNIQKVCPSIIIPAKIMVSLEMSCAKKKSDTFQTLKFRTSLNFGQIFNPIYFLLSVRNLLSEIRKFNV